MFRKTILFLTFMITSTIIACTSNISHPPSSEEILNHSKNDDIYDPDLYEALQYDSDDIKIIKKQKNINYIIAAAYQLHPSESVDLLVDYLPEIKKNILGLSLLISCALQEDELNNELPIEDLSKNLISLSPSNGYVYYIIAYYYAKTGDLEKCIKYTKHAIDAPIFDNFWSEYSGNSISTSIFLGYSKLAAQIHALGLQHDIMLYFKLSKYIINETKNIEHLHLCNKMGTVLKSCSTTILGDYMSIAIQKKSLEKLGDFQDTETELSKIEPEKSRLKNLTDYLHVVGDSYSISEKRWVQYYEDLYGNSETLAIKKLMGEYPIGNIKSDE